MDGWRMERPRAGWEAEKKNASLHVNFACLAKEQNKRAAAGAKREGTTHTTAIIIMTGPHPPRTALRAFRSGSRPPTRRKEPRGKGERGKWAKKAKKGEDKDPTEGQERGPGGDVYDFFCLWCVDSCSIFIPLCIESSSALRARIRTFLSDQSWVACLGISGLLRARNGEGCV